MAATRRRHRAVARAELPDGWRRYCAIAATHDPTTTSPEAAGRRRLRKPAGTKNLEAWGSAALDGALRLEKTFSAAFISAAADGRWVVAATSGRDGRWGELEAGIWAVTGITLDLEIGNIAIPGAPRLLGVLAQPAARARNDAAATPEDKPAPAESAAEKTKPEATSPGATSKEKPALKPQTPEAQQQVFDTLIDGLDQIPKRPDLEHLIMGCGIPRWRVRNLITERAKSDPRLRGRGRPPQS